MAYIGMALIYGAFLAAMVWLVTTGHPWFGFLCLLFIPGFEAVPKAYKKTKAEMKRQQAALKN